jgi:ABC-2 type transport system permease protein
MNIFVRELKANFKSLIIWGVIVVLIVLEALIEFSGFAGNPEMLAILDTMPQALLDAFSMQAFNLTTVSGLFGIMFTYLSLILSIAAAMWGSDIISKEERDKTVEFSLTLPVTRSKVVTAKALAALVNCIGLLLIAWGASIGFSAKYNPDSDFYSFLALEMAAVFVLQLIFLAFGIFLGCAMKHYKRAGSIAVSLLLGTFFLSIFSGLSEDLEFLKYFTPFKYFNPATMLHESKIDINFVWLSAAIIAVLMVGAYVSYAKRDLYI